MIVHLRRLLPLLGVVVLTTLGCDERLEKRYGSLEEARRDGALARGWVPAVLPESASDIIEFHDLDTNETWGTFKFSPTGSAAFRAALVEPGSEEQLVAPRRPGVARWWPDFLHGRLDGGRLSGARLSLYRLGGQKPEAREAGRVFFAVNWEDGVAYFWRGEA